MKSLLRLGAVAFGFAVALPASATTLAPLTVDQMTDASDAIVRGTVTTTWTMIDDQGHVWTRANVRVDEVLKGDPASTITVEAAGGVLNGVVYEVPLAARYDEGEDVFLFLTEKPARGVYGTVAMYGGKYSVRINPQDGEEMVVLFTLPYSKDYDARFIPHPPVDQRLGLATLEAQVRARVELGWDGKPIPGISNERLRSINRLQPGVK